jgi:uncharacterized protein YaiL (DUF2058 family)
VQQSKAEQSSTQHNKVEQCRADQTVAKKQKNLILAKTEQTQKKCYTLHTIPNLFGKSVMLKQKV